MSTKSIGPGEVPLSPEEKRLSMSQTSPSGLDAVVRGRGGGREEEEERDLLVINVTWLLQVEESKPPPTIAVSKPPLKKSFTVDVRSYM